MKPDDSTVSSQKVDEAESEERGSFGGPKKDPRWLWQAIDHHPGTVRAYVFGRRTEEVWLGLRRLREPFGLTRYYTDYWGADERHLVPAGHCPGKRNTQQIARQHLRLRTRINRLVRQTICFSQSTQVHAIVSGWFGNRYEFGLAV